LAIPAADQQPFIKDDRVYVPLRAVGEGLNFEVQWVGATRRVVITTGGRDGAQLPARTGGLKPVQIVVDGRVKEISPGQGEPFVTAAGRTVVPLRAVGEALDCAVDWDSAARQVTIRSKPKPPPPPPPSRGPEEYGETRPMPPPGGGLLAELAAYRTNILLLGGTRINTAELLGRDEGTFSPAQLDKFRSDLDELRKFDARVRLPDGREWAVAELTILGPAIATADQLRAWLEAEARKRVRTEQWGREFVPFPDLVDLYLRIGAEYGVRGDLALAQAAKETGYWQFTGLVQPDQNNFCGLWAISRDRPLTGREPLNGADPSRVRLEAGRHGATFATPEAGVEAHIQHLYAYATSAATDLPPGKTLLSPRFVYVQRGCAPTWQGLNARWAVPGTTYGQSIIRDYWLKAFDY
jgi:hypothetical protein